jgi:hypothetical protein
METNITKISGRWTAGLSNPEKMLFQELLGTNNKVLDRLTKICYNMVKDSEIDSSDYETPNWELRQADKVGYRRALKQIILLCTLKDDNPNI